MRKVFIATSSFAKNSPAPLEMLKAAGLDVEINPHGRRLSESEITAFLSDKEYLIAGTESLTRKVIESAKYLKVISRCGVGMDNVDMEAAKSLGIKVFNTPDAPTLAVAELTVGLILDLLRRVSFMDRNIRRGQWQKTMGNLLSGKKVGIIGFGRIGRRTAELLKNFGCEIAYTDPCKGDELSGFKCLTLEMLLKWADIISLHVSVKDTLIGGDEIRNMKPGAWLVNVSRGGVVDETALHQALKNSHLSGAALDVFDREPYSGPLTELNNIILTPHIGSYAKEARVEMELQAVRNLLMGLGFE